MTDFIRNEEVSIWQELASVIVPIAVLSVLFFTLWEQGQNLGEREGMQYGHFLMLALTGAGICVVIYHVIGFFENLFLKAQKNIVKIIIFLGLLLGVGLVANFLRLVSYQRGSMLFLAFMVGIIGLFLLVYVRLPLKQVLYEVYLRVLFPIAIFLLFLFVTVYRVDPFAVLLYTSYAYFSARPFVKHCMRVRPAGISET